MILGPRMRFHLPPPRTIRSYRQQVARGMPSGPSTSILGEIGKPVGHVDGRASSSQRTEPTAMSSSPFLLDEASDQETGLLF